MVESVDPFINTNVGLVPVLRNHMFTMLAAFAGVLLGIIGSAGFVGSYLQSQFEAQTSALHKQLVNLTPAADYTSAGACYSPSTAGSSGGAVPAVTAATAPAATEPGRGGDEGGGSTTPPSTFVQQLITGTISNTGPGSTNQITASNSYTATTVNKNNVHVDNDNEQHASSGSVSASGDTTTGSTQSGNAQNTNTTSTSISIEN